MRSIKTTDTKSGNHWFFFMLLYLIIDYARPQDVLPIGFMKPGMLSVMILVFYLISSGKISQSICKQTRLILGFALLVCLYIPFAVNNRYAFEAACTMVLYIPFILSTIIVVNNIKKLNVFIFTMVIIMIYVCVYSLTHDRVAGNYFQDENDLALFINTILPFCYYLLLYDTNIKRRLTCAIALGIGLMTILVSFSRGGFVGLLSMFAIVWLFSPRKILSLIFIFLMVGILVFYGGETYKERLASATETDKGTAFERILSWEAGWRMFLDNPWGVGGNNFQVRFPEYQSDLHQRGMYGRVAHSLWFTLIPELGVVGIIIYSLLFYYNINDLFFLKKLSFSENPDLRYLHYIGLGLLASFTGYFASGTFISVLYYPHYWYLTGVLVAVRRVALNLISTKN